eukprot:5656247-Heterocapsa_arctica.AAC.1
MMYMYNVERSAILAIDSLLLSDFDSRDEALAHADEMVADMRREVGLAADKPDQISTNPLRS